MFLNIITEINESKILQKNISCKCECRSDGRRGNSASVGTSVKILKNIICAKEIIFGILLHVVMEMVKI